MRAVYLRIAICWSLLVVSTLDGPCVRAIGVVRKIDDCYHLYNATYPTGHSRLSAFNRAYAQTAVTSLGGGVDRPG